MSWEINLDSILALDKQIAQQERALIQLKRIRNSLLNVSTLLPPEILGNIFRWNAIPDPGDFGGLPKGSYNFLLVCHHWFEVASRTPELWSFWGNSIQDWAHRHARSGTAPLDLVLGEDTGRALDDRLRDALKDRAARDAIRRVHLRATNADPINSVISAIVAGGEGARQSSIESFVVRNHGKRSVDVSAFFSRYRLPKLQHLCLYDCGIPPWDLLKSQTMTLTTLELAVAQMLPTPTITQLLGILSSNPLLQYLKLFRALSIGPADSDRTIFPPVPLHHLKDIELTAGPFSATELLNHLELPDKMDAMKLILYNCSPSDISQILGPFIGDRVRRRGRIPGGGLVLRSCSTPEYIKFSAGSAYESGALNEVVWFVRVPAYFGEELEDEEINRLHLDLIAHIPLDQVISLETTLPILRSEELCIGMTNLTHLHLRDVDLSTWFVEPEISGAHSFKDILPGLGSIEITYCSLSGGWDAFTNFLYRRAAVGNRVSSLKFNSQVQMGEHVAEIIERMVDVFDDRVDGWPGPDDL